MKRAAIVLGPGGHNVAGNRRLKDATSRLSARLGAEVGVTAAFVRAGTWGAQPSLGEAVEACVRSGVEEIAIVPGVVEWAYPEHIDVPDLVRELAQAHPGVRLRIGRPLGMQDGIETLLAQAVKDTWTRPEAGSASEREVAAVMGQTPITTARLAEDELPMLPAHAQHVLLCSGRRCAELGSADGYRTLTALLAERELDTGAARVKVTRTKCLGPCSAAPVACLYPSGAFFARLEETELPAFVERVLVGGGELPGHTFRPGGGAGGE